eukprot:COSAG02_NODE_8763_length_2452_cov_11.538462_4_plen_48_part_00
MLLCIWWLGAFGKTWRKGKGKAAAAITRLVSLQEQVSRLALSVRLPT